MKTNPAIIQQLNQLLKNELTAINQFFLHARMSRHWGFDRLNDKEYQASIKAMKLADNLIERILFLEGLPNLQDLGRLMIGEDVPELLTGDLQFRCACRNDIIDTISFCETEQDYVSRELLDSLLEEVEEHIDWLETQLDLIEKTGLQNYLQSAI
ncbi:MAG: bacterioferritin [Methylococcales bacterium]|nr:bacterioferritin [Methylococcales bacterium]MCK5478036.1 bacterioferritin [Methylococcales bacterium]